METLGVRMVVGDAPSRQGRSEEINEALTCLVAAEVHENHQAILFATKDAPEKPDSNGGQSDEVVP